MTSRLILPTAKTLIKTFATNAATSGGVHKFTLPSLPYAYDALEPAISGKIMETHHTKHHQVSGDGFVRERCSESALATTIVLFCCLHTRRSECPSNLLLQIFAAAAAVCARVRDG